MEALKAEFARLAERIKQATDHKSLVQAVNEMTEFLSKEKNRLAVDEQAAMRRTANSTE